jgi:hypothetical protein
MDVSVYLYIHSAWPDERRIEVLDMVGLLVEN